ncbi:MAG: carboxypeptidase M32, partial [Caldilineaceae bacterium]
GDLLSALRSYADQLPYDHDEAALIRVTQREYDRAVKVPVKYAAEMASLNARSYNAWTKARASDNFAAVQPLLEKKLEMCQQLSQFLTGYEHPADPWIAEFDYGMTVATIRPLFFELRQWLTPLVRAITSKPEVENGFLRRYYSPEKQLAFSENAVRAYGYDFGRGRQDLTHHPFMTKFSLNDVRITTRVFEHDGVSALFSSLHEAGHALYEQGINLAYEGTPLAIGTSAGVHESQSRLWENLIGRSHAFWQHFYPQFQNTFPEQTQNVSLDEFYRGVNKVDRSLIRVEADEVTYNLHVIIRFELELEMLEGKLAIADLPQAWRQRYGEYLGIIPEDDKDGCLQDVHWFSGSIGGSFQGYTLGNIMAAQFYEAALKAHPEIPSQIAQGKFDTLLHWLQQNIYQHGSKFTTAELLERVTGGPLSLEPYKRYIENKYSALYGL